MIADRAPGVESAGADSPRAMFVPSLEQKWVGMRLANGPARQLKIERIVFIPAGNLEFAESKLLLCGQADSEPAALCKSVQTSGRKDKDDGTTGIGAVVRCGGDTNW